MSLCASCGLENGAGTQLCLHHHVVYGDEWSKANKIWCDYFHRNVAITEIPQQWQ